MSASRSGDFWRKFEQAKERVAARVQPAMEAAGAVLLAESNVFIPKDTIVLHYSGRVRVEGSGQNTVVIVGYGRKDLIVTGIYSPHEKKIVDRVPFTYAVYVHYDMEKYHPNGQALFLEIACKTARPAMRQAIIDVMRGV